MLKGFFLSRGALLGVALLVPLNGCSVSSEEEQRVFYQPVEAIEVAAQDSFEVTRSFTGVVRASQSADIAFEFGGTVRNVLVNEGDRVDAGEILATLDTALLEIERRQLQAQLAEAQANRRLTLANLERQASLETDGYASRQRRDELEAGRDVITASINHLQAALDGNHVKQEKAQLYAPFSGVVSERYLQQGSAAAPGSPALRLLETGSLEAHIGIPRQLATVITPGQTVDVTIAGKTVSGEVLAVGAELKARSHAVNIRIGLPASDALSGSLVEIQLPDRIDAAGFLLPESALTASLRGLWRVYVLQPEADQLFRVEARDLQLRYSGESTAFVVGGLKDGESVIASGVHKVVAGQLVRRTTAVASL